MAIRLTDERGGLFTRLPYSREVPRSEIWLLRRTTCRPLEDAALLKSRLDRSGELHFKITAAGRKALDAVAPIS
jgi:hypothetical protein